MVFVNRSWTISFLALKTGNDIGKLFVLDGTVVQYSPKEIKSDKSAYLICSKV